MTGAPGNKEQYHIDVRGAAAARSAPLSFRFRSTSGNIREDAAAAMAREMRWRWLKLSLACLALVVGGYYVGTELIDIAQFEMPIGGGTDTSGVLIAATTAFVVTSAIPFVPGAEIGFGLILMFGAKVVALVYASMVTALTLSFLIGRVVPAERVATLFGYFGLTKARALALRMGPLSPKARLDLLSDNLPSRFAPLLLRHRHLALIALINLPGNSVVGGGGGIAFTAGLSGLYSLPGFFATLLVAVAPVPLCVLASSYLW